ncbi:MAG: glycosyl transferase family protein [Kiloniellales bacterium]|nr:glycosyl transferase family protein [Kiloniellales bacterium]
MLHQGGEGVQDVIGAKALPEGRRDKDRSPAKTGDHPFAGFIRIIGRGKHLSRPLDRSEAAEAMAMILAGEVEAAQLGAFLLLLRYRGETPPELAGFVEAARDVMAVPTDLRADLDWPSYADRHRQLPYFLLAALLLAEQGVKVAMHGLAGVGSVTTPKVLEALGLAAVRSFGEAAEELEARSFTYLPIETFCPPLAGLFSLRPVLGVRSAANSFARELNPLGAPFQLQGVFHPTYLPLHQETARLLEQPRAAIFKGGGGEVQRNPEKPCRVATLSDGDAGKETWAASTPAARHPWRDETLDPATVVALWRGERAAPGPEAAVIGTAAIALKLLGRAESREQAEAQATELWHARPKLKYGS